MAYRPSIIGLPHAAIGRTDIHSIAAAISGIDGHSGSASCDQAVVLYPKSGCVRGQRRRPQRRPDVASSNTRNALSPTERGAAACNARNSSFCRCARQRSAAAACPGITQPRPNHSSR